MLQQLNLVSIRIVDKGHGDFTAGSRAGAPAQVAADSLELGADIINRLDRVSHVSIGIAPCVGARVPVMGKFKHWRLFRRKGLVAGRSQEDEREPVLWIVLAGDHFKPQPLAIKTEALCKVGHSDHGVQVSHEEYLSRSVW